LAAGRQTAGVALSKVPPGADVIQAGQYAYEAFFVTEVMGGGAPKLAIVSASWKACSIRIGRFSLCRVRRELHRRIARRGRAGVHTIGVPILCCICAGRPAFAAVGLTADHDLARLRRPKFGAAFMTAIIALSCGKRNFRRPATIQWPGVLSSRRSATQLCRKSNPHQPSNDHFACVTTWRALEPGISLRIAAGASSSRSVRRRIAFAVPAPLRDRGRPAAPSPRRAFGSGPRIAGG